MPSQPADHEPIQEFRDVSNIHGINPYALIGALTIGFIAFGAVYYFTKEKPPEPQLMAIERPATEATPDRPLEPKKEPPVSAPPEQPRRPVVEREFAVPSPGKDERAESKANHFESVALNYDGSRLLTTSEKTIIRWNTTTGERVRTFERGDRWKQRLYGAPDTRTVVQLHYDTQSVAVYNAETGATLGTYHVSGSLRHYADGRFPAFTADGEEFIFVERFEKDPNTRPYALHVVNLREGKGRPLAPNIRILDEQRERDMIGLYPVPGQPVVVALTQYRGMRDSKDNAYTINVNTGEVKPIAWLANESVHLTRPNDGIHVSPDGKQVLFQSRTNGVSLGAWPKGTVQPLPAVGSYRLTRDQRWLPDGYRMLRINAWDQNYIKIGIGTVAGYQTDYLELVDLTRDKVVSSIPQSDLRLTSKDSVLRCLAVSGDGKKIALGGPQRVALVNFEHLYNGPVLPPMRHAKGYWK